MSDIFVLQTIAAGHLENLSTATITYFLDSHMISLANVLLLEGSEYFSDHDKVFCSEDEFAFFLQGRSISSASTFCSILTHFLLSNYHLMSKIFLVEILFLRNKIMGVLRNYPSSEK